MTNLGNLAFILIIFSTVLRDSGVVMAATIAAVLDCPASLLASLFVHQLGKRPTVWGSHFGTVLCTVISAFLIGKFVKNCEHFGEDNKETEGSTLPRVLFCFFLFAQAGPLRYYYSQICSMVPHRDQQNIEPISGLNH